MITFFKKNKWVIPAAIAVIAVLVIAFISGGKTVQTTPAAVQSATTCSTEATTTADTQTKATEKTEPTSAAVTEVRQETTVPGSTTANVEENTEPAVEETTELYTEHIATQETKAAASGQENKSSVAPVKKSVKNKSTSSAIQKETEPKKDKYKTDPIPQGIPEPVEPQDQEIKDTTLNCTVSISCSTILDNMDKLDEDLHELVPADGYLLAPVNVEFQDGESVFDVLKRTCTENKLHLEFSMSPVYNTAYIEGIGNLYEFDCGANSGWMYKVNDRFPNYGCSRYALNDGDVICWLYTCELGKDVGGSNMYISE